MDESSQGEYGNVEMKGQVFDDDTLTILLYWAGCYGTIGMMELEDT